MIWRPRPGDRVVLWYSKKKRRGMPYHGRAGTVITAGRGRGPINALVNLDCGGKVIVPRGQLQEATWLTSH